MHINASITSWKHIAEPRGDGRPSLGDELVPGPTRPLPARLVTPGSHAIQSAAMRSVKLDLVLQLMPAMLVRFGIAPALGDRLTIVHVKPGANVTIRAEVTEERPDETAGLVGVAGQTVLGLKKVGDGV